MSSAIAKIRVLCTKCGTAETQEHPASRDLSDAWYQVSDDHSDHLHVVSLEPFDDSAQSAALAKGLKLMASAAMRYQYETKHLTPVFCDENETPKATQSRSIADRISEITRTASFDKCLEAAEKAAADGLPRTSLLVAKWRLETLIGSLRSAGFMVSRKPEEDTDVMAMIGIEWCRKTPNH